jgi:hypothetical protein
MAVLAASAAAPCNAIRWSALMNLRLKTLTATAVFALLASGCASSGGDADRMTVEQASRMFKQGDELVKKGEQVRVAGKAQIAEGEQKIAEGDKMIEKGEALKSESERVFREASKSAKAD